MRANQAFLKFLSVSVIAAAVTGCAADDGGDSAQSANSSLAISAYCPFLPSKTFDSQVMVTGTAHYQYRVNGSGPIAKEPLPIRFAEIEVRDSHGAIVQCAETTRTGRFSFALPKNNQNDNVHIN